MVYGKYNIITIVFMGFINQHSHHVWGHHPAVRLTGRFHSSSKVPGREMVQIPVLNTPHAPMVPMECGEYIYIYVYYVYVYMYIYIFTLNSKRNHALVDIYILKHGFVCCLMWSPGGWIISYYIWIIHPISLKSDIVGEVIVAEFCSTLQCLKHVGGLSLRHSPVCLNKVKDSPENFRLSHWITIWECGWSLLYYYGG